MHLVWLQGLHKNSIYNWSSVGRMRLHNASSCKITSQQIVYKRSIFQRIKHPISLNDLTLYVNYDGTVLCWHLRKSRQTFSTITPVSSRSANVLEILWDSLWRNIIFLTHWGRDIMAGIFQTTFLEAFSWKKMYKFRLGFHWCLFRRVQLTMFQHWFR